MKTIIVTGGLGFIGSNFIEMVLTNPKYKGVKIINIDNDSFNRKNHKHLEHIKQISDKNRYEYKCASICNLTKMQALIYFHRPDKIVHFAAETHVDYSISEPQKHVKSNVVGTMNMLIASSKYYNRLLNDEQKKQFRFHHISTDQVFGDFPIDSLQKFTQDSKYRPSSPYSATKASADMLVHAWSRSYGLPISISNCSNNYGRYQDESKLIPKVIGHCFRKEPIPIHGTGLYIRDWIHAKDHCRGILMILQNLQKTQGQTFLFGGDCQKSNLWIIDTICQIMDQKYPMQVSYKTLKTFVDNRVGQDNRYAIDNSNSYRVLGWKSIYNLNETIEQMVQEGVQNGCILV